MSLLKSQANKEILNFHKDEPSVAELIYSLDWSATQFGAIETWPNSLKTLLVRIPLRFVSLHEWIQRGQVTLPLMQEKHPNGKENSSAYEFLKEHIFIVSQALFYLAFNDFYGKPAKEVWAETWDALEPIFDGVISTRQGLFVENLSIFILRAGYNEECYFSSAFNPLFAEDRTVIGVFTAAYETTQKVVSARRLKVLGELGKRTPAAKSVESACHLVTNVLRNHNADLTFGLIYLIEKNQNDKVCIARLAATTFDENLLIKPGGDGIDELVFVTGQSSRTLPDFLPDTPNFLDVMQDSNKSKTDDNGNPESSTVVKEDNKLIPNLSSSSSSSNFTAWPLQEVIRNNKDVVFTLADESRAILFPVSTPFAGKSLLTAVLICGINKHRALDKEYLDFCQLMVGHVSSSLKNGRSREEERKQAEFLADLDFQKIKFFQNISHELTTPLTLMLGPLGDAITACKPDSLILYNLEMIQRNARRLLKLSNNLLQFSQIEAGNMTANYRQTNIAEITKELASNFESIAKSFGLTFTIDIPTAEHLESRLDRKVYLDLDFYEKIIFNLCFNAFKYTWHGGVTIRLYPDKKESNEVVIVEVSDTGVGIAKEHLENLFRRFYRVESQESRSNEGSGIGLALVKELIKKHGGDIKVISQVGIGTTFQIWIPTGDDHLPKNNFGKNDGKIQKPLIQDKQLSNSLDLYLEETKQWITRKHVPDIFYSEIEDHDDDAKATVEHLSNLSITSSKTGALKENLVLPKRGVSNDLRRLYRVLIVEDNSDMRNYLTQILKTEFEVSCACDGRHALMLIANKKFQPDLVLSDIMMPHMNGLELLKALRSEPYTQRIPLILLSARAGEEASVEGLETGADDYLIKPFRPRELIARVRANVELSNLRHELVVQERHKNQTRELLFSISSKIRSGLNIQEILSMAVKEIHRILACDSALILFSDPMNKGSAKIMASSAYHPEIQALVGTHVPCRVIHENQKIWNEEIDGFPDFNEPTCSVSSFLAPFVDIADVERDVLDLETKSDNNHFSKILDKYVSSMSVSIRQDSSSCGWIFAHRNPDETWSGAEKLFMQQVSNQITLAVTHAKLLEEKLKRESQMKAVKAANKAKSQILANTSHELLTPLGAIIGVLSGFDDTLLTSEQKDMIQIMTHASDIVLSIINDILDVAKLEAHKITLTDRTFDLFDLVEKTVEICGERAGAKQIELVLLFEQPSELPKYVKSDPERLNQILTNLLSNSLKFTDSGEIVLKISWVSSSEAQVQATTGVGDSNVLKNGTLRFDLTDTGAGIHPNFMKDIWESFSQGDHSITRSQDGTGLGLSICKHLVTINGGEIGAQSELGIGSHFWFSWNVGFLAVNATPLRSSSQVVPVERILVIPAAVKSKRIVVVDSVEISRLALVAMLTSSVQKVKAFDDCLKAVTETNAWQNQYQSSPCDVVFFNVDKRNSEQVLVAAKRFQSICGKDKLAIGLFIFWSAEGRALGKELIAKIGGHTAAFCKPVMQRRLLDCLQNMEIFESGKIYEPTPQIGLLNNRFQDLNAGLHDIPEPNIETVKEVPSTPLSAEEIPTISRPIPSRPSSKRSASDEIRDPKFFGVSNKSRTRTVSQSKCILCVEENPANLKAIQDQLTMLGYQYLSATNSQEVINIMRELDESPTISSRQNKISLILVDCAMPLMSGFAVSRAIRAMRPSQHEIPIIALISSAVEGIQDKCLESGINDYLTKPLKISQLKNKLIQWLGNN
ncbi:hypothetical protein G9A89_001888 [Geosiphon pyriformis]|nr:hypothetical protein G9A89_001888 [Geosiphon pyriformis]